MKAKNVSLVNKLRAFLIELLELEKVSIDDLTILFDELIVGDTSTHTDKIVNEAKVLMSDYLSREIISSDEMQVIIDQAINVSRVSSGSVVVSTQCSLSVTGGYPSNKFEIN